MDEEIRHFGDFVDRWTTVLAILAIMVVLAVFVLVVTLPSKPNSSITTSISNRATTVSTISSTTTANLERLSIANYSYNSEHGSPSIHKITKMSYFLIHIKIACKQI